MAPNNPPAAGSAGIPATPAGDAAAIIDFARELSECVFHPFEDQRGVVAVPKGTELKSLKGFIDEYAERPDRKIGTSTHQTLASFVAHVNRHKDANSVIFADHGAAADKVKAASLRALYDYNEAGNGAARFGGHRALYPCPVSEEWQFWLGKDNKPMSQADFAQFLEDRMVDVAPPPTSIEQYPAALRGDLNRLPGKIAEPGDLLDLARGLEVRSDLKLKNAVKLESGEVKLNYETTNETFTAAGSPIQVPHLFLIGIPVFHGGARVPLLARLRYRPAGGTVMWFYELWRADKAFDEAFGQVVAEAEKTELPVFHGKPE